jgi:hypothetical protein
MFPAVTTVGYEIFAFSREQPKSPPLATIEFLFELGHIIISSIASSYSKAVKCMASSRGDTQ